MKIKSITIALLSLVLLISLSATSLFVSADEIDSSDAEIIINAKSAVLADSTGQNIFFEQNANDRRPIASMVKIMTLNIIFDEIMGEKLSLSEEVVASENASSMGGSQAFLDAHNSYVVDELIKSIIVASANDSCVALAERISFSVDNFVCLMNDIAIEYGMHDTNFVNCTGLPAVGQYSTAHDVAIMFGKLIGHSEFYEYAGEWMYNFAHPSGRTTTLTNTNKLIRHYEGCDGGKTGFTNEAMSCLSATAVRGDTRLISIVMGADSSKVRNAEICKLFDYGFANWKSTRIINNELQLEDKVSVPNSKEKYITVRPAENYDYYVNSNEDNEYEISTTLYSNYPPINVGDKVGELVVIKNGEKIVAVPLIADESASKIEYTDIITDLIAKW